MELAITASVHIVWIFCGSFFYAISERPSHDQTPKNWTLTQADKQNKLQACTKEKFLLL